MKNAKAQFANVYLNRSVVGPSITFMHDGKHAFDVENEDEERKILEELS